MSKITDLLDRLRSLLPRRRRGLDDGDSEPDPDEQEAAADTGPTDSGAAPHRAGPGTRLLQRLRDLLPSRRARAGDGDEGGDGDGAFSPDPAASPATSDGAEILPDDLEEDRLLIERARRRLLWKKRLLIGVPVVVVGLGLLAAIATGIAYLLAPGEEPAPAPVEATLSAPAPDGAASVKPPQAEEAGAPATDAPKPDPEEEIRRLKAERDALEEENRTLAERNRKLVEAAAKRNAPRPQRSAGTEPKAEPPPDPSADCTISDPSNLAESLRRCIDDFNTNSR